MFCTQQLRVIQPMKPISRITYRGEFGHGDGPAGAALAEMLATYIKALIRSLNLEMSL